MIDRYYDAMDLNNTKIFIEWETPKDKNGGVTKSVSEHYLKIIDDVNYPGKLIFGWPISEAITKASGTLKFSVRFIQWEDTQDGKKKVVYSFNTLTAQVSIAPNLGLDLEKDNYNVDNCNDLLLERIQPGVVVGGAQAKIPYYLQNIVVLDDGYDIEPNHSEGSYTLQVVATADDTGAVSYVWERSDLNENNVSADAWFEIPNSNKVKMFPVTEEELEAMDYKLPEGHTYFVTPDEGVSFQKYEGGRDLKATEDYLLNDSIPTLYENRGYFEVTQYGEYRAKARNRIFNSLTTKNSEVAKFKRPNAIKMLNENQTPNKHILKTETAVLTPAFEESVGDLEYQWYRAEENPIASEKFNFLNLPTGGKVSFGSEFARILCPTDPSVYGEAPAEGNTSYTIKMRHFVPENAVYFRVAEVNNLSLEPDPIVTGEETLVTIKDMDTYVKDEQEQEYFDRQIQIATFTNGAWKSLTENKGVDEYVGHRYNYVWYDANGNEVANYVFKIQLANENNFNAFENYQVITGATNLSYTAEEPGLYQLAIKRIRNTAETENQSIEYRVTHEPTVPTAGEGTYDGQKLIFVTDLLDKESGIALDVNWNSEIKADEYYISWKMYRKDRNLQDLLITTQKVPGHVKTVSFNPTNELYSSIFEENKENIEGLYYAIFASKLNGEMSEYSDVPNPTVMFTVVGS